MKGERLCRDGETIVKKLMYKDKSLSHYYTTLSIANILSRKYLMYLHLSLKCRFNIDQCIPSLIKELLFHRLNISLYFLLKLCYIKTKSHAMHRNV